MTPDEYAASQEVPGWSFDHHPETGLYTAQHHDIVVVSDNPENLHDYCATFKRPNTLFRRSTVDRSTVEAFATLCGRSVESITYMLGALNVGVAQPVEVGEVADDDIEF